MLHSILQFRTLLNRRKTRLDSEIDSNNRGSTEKKSIIFLLIMKKTDSRGYVMLIA